MHREKGSIITYHARLAHQIVNFVKLNAKFEVCRKKKILYSLKVNGLRRES